MKFKRPEEYLAKEEEQTLAPANPEPVKPVEREKPIANQEPAPGLSEVDVERIAQKLIDAQVSDEDFFRRLQDHVRARKARHGNFPPTGALLDEIISDCVGSRPPEAPFVRPTRPAVMLGRQ
jgi:hypothetical protein